MTIGIIDDELDPDVVGNVDDVKSVTMVDNEPEDVNVSLAVVEYESKGCMSAALESEVTEALVSGT